MKSQDRVVIEGPKEMTALSWYIFIRPDGKHCHRIDVNWQQFQTSNGFSGSMGVSTRARVAGLLGSTGLREVLPTHWWFDSQNASSGSQGTNITQSAAEAIVSSLAEKVRAKLTAKPAQAA